MDLSTNLIRIETCTFLGNRYFAYIRLAGLN